MRILAAHLTGWIWPCGLPPPFTGLASTLHIPDSDDLHHLLDSLLTFSAGCFLLCSLAFSGGWLPILFIQLVFTLYNQRVQPLQLFFALEQRYCGSAFYFPHHLKPALGPFWNLDNCAFCFQQHWPFLRVCPLTHHPRDCRKPGPKSRRQLFWTSALLCVLGVFLMSQFTDRSEGCIPATEDAGTPTSWIQQFLDSAGVKHCGIQPTGRSGKFWPAETKVIKRSLRRACARAHRDGLSWYRGRCQTPQDFAEDESSFAT